MRTNITESIRKLAQQVVAYDVEKDPAVSKMMAAVKAVQEGRWPNAENLLKSVEGNMSQRSGWYKMIPALKNISPMFAQAQDLIHKKDPSAANVLNQIRDTLKKHETEITQKAQGLGVGR